MLNCPLLLLCLIGSLCELWICCFHFDLPILLLFWLLSVRLGRLCFLDLFLIGIDIHQYRRLLMLLISDAFDGRHRRPDLFLHLFLNHLWICLWVNSRLNLLPIVNILCRGKDLICLLYYDTWREGDPGSVSPILKFFLLMIFVAV